MKRLHVRTEWLVVAWSIRVLAFRRLLHDLAEVTTFAFFGGPPSPKWNLPALGHYRNLEKRAEACLRALLIGFRTLRWAVFQLVSQHFHLTECSSKD